MLTVAAIFCLSTMDATVKSLTDTNPVLQMVWIRYTGQTLLVAFLIRRQLKTVLHTRHAFLHLLRSFLLFFGTFCFFTGFSKIELASATTILQTSPLFIALGAHFVLGEKLGWQRVAGVVIGLAGTLVIMRPGTDLFSIYSVYPLGAAIGYSGYAIVTRLLSRDEGIWTSFFYTTLLGSVFSSIAVPFVWVTPEVSDMPWFLVLTIFGAAGQYLLIRSLFLVEATIVAPFTYVALVFAALHGALFFDEFPDFWTYIGAAIVAGSGLFVWYRESQAAKS
ncbi:MAG: DMT family transporter [Rhodobacteraceae bacterium]|nr:DMT family transporter [Paracoccaceae bacterium]